MGTEQHVRIAASLVAAGVLVSAVGVTGLVAGWADSTTRTVRVVDGRGGDATATLETPEEFLGRLAEALRTGDTEFLVERLHPAVLARYGEEVCRMDVQQLRDETTRLDVVRSEGSGDFAWATDGQTTTIPDTLSVVVNRVAHGETAQVTVHITRIAGRYTWFTDCT